MKSKKFIIFISVFFILIACICTALYCLDKNTVKEDEKAAIELYKKLIDLTIRQNSTLSLNARYISVYVNNFVDPLNGKRISEDGKQELLKYFEKHNSTVYNKTCEELIEMKLGSENALYGSSITANILFKGTLSLRIYRAINGASTTTYNIKYEKGIWFYEDSDSRGLS